MKSIDTKNFFLYLAVFAVVLAVVFLLINNISIYGKRKAVSEQAENLQKQVQELKVEEALLQGKIIESQQVEYLEKVAREELNFKKPDEKVVAFPMIDEPAVPATTTEQGSLWQKILDKVK